MKLEYAKRYLSFGWSIIPISPDTKTPTIKWAKYQENPPTLEEVEAWLEKGWHLALVTGKVSGVVIVDDDRKKHGLDEWDLQSSIVAKTKNGGKHYYYAWDREIHTHCNAELFIDFKGWHSYCLLPPFGNYEWISNPTAENRKKLKPLSDDLVRLINSDVKKDDQGWKQPVNVGDLLSVPEGSRTNSLYRLACSIFNKYSTEEAAQILAGVNQTYQPPLSQKEFNVQVDKAYQFVKAHPKEQAGKQKGKITPYTLGEIATMRIQDRQLEKEAPSTGIIGLDKIIKGFIPSHLYVLTGHTNIGKSSLAACFTNSLARQGKKVTYFSLEPDVNIADFLASVRLRKPFEELTDEDINFDDPNIQIVLKEQIRTIEELVKYVRNSDRQDLIVVDHIGYFTTGQDNVFTKQADVMKELAALAKHKKVAILVVAHLNKKAGKIPSADDISGSAAFKQDATEVLILTRDRDENDEFGVTFLNTGYLIVAKSKTGRTGSLPLAFGERQAGIYQLSPADDNDTFNFAKRIFGEGGKNDN